MTVRPAISLARYMTVKVLPIPGGPNSDYPVATPRETFEGALAVNRVVEGTSLPRVPEDALRAALERDTLALFGISR